MTYDNAMQLMRQNQLTYWTLEKLISFEWRYVGAVNDNLFIKNEDENENINLDSSLSQLDDLINKIGAGTYKITASKKQTGNGSKKVVYTDIIIKDAITGIGLNGIPTFSMDDIQRRIDEATRAARIESENEQLKREIKEYEEYYQENEKNKSTSVLGSLFTVENIPAILQGISTIVQAFKGGTPANNISGIPEQQSNPKTQATERAAALIYETFETAQDFDDLQKFIELKRQQKQTQ